MGAGHSFEIDSMKDKRKQINPAWSAIGCFTVVGLSAAGYFLGQWFVGANAENHWIYLPLEWAWPPQSPYLIIKLAFALIVFLFGSAVFSIVYTIINPPKPGRFDVTDATIFPPAPRRRR
jgi:hypothetical protein